MPDKALVAEVKARGMIITNFESLMVRRDFHNGVSVFSFTPSEVDRRAIKLQPGDPVTISLGGHQVINGVVTTRSVAYDATSHQVVIAGKSWTADVHDSSVPVRPGSFDGMTFEQIARGVLAPHKSSLMMRNPTATASLPFQRMRLQFGETCGELISRLAAMRGMFVWDDENGNVVVGQGNPGAGSVAELAEGRNILRASGVLDDQTVFSKYTGISQSATTVNDQPPRYYSSTLDNPNTRANRTKLFVAPHPADSAGELGPVVNMEANRSQWESVDVSVTVLGWLKPDGTLYEPTDNISVYSPMIFPNASGAVQLGVQSCTYSQSTAEGTTTTLALLLPWMLTSSPSYGLKDAGGSGESDKTIANPTPTPPHPDAPDFGGAVDL